MTYVIKRISIVCAILGMALSPAPIEASISNKTVATLVAAGITAGSISSLKARYQEYKKNLVWDWKKIGTDNTDTFALDPNIFPKDFYFGAGNSAIQSEGGITNSSYCADCHKTEYPDLIGQTNDAWNRWPQDIALLNQMALNSYRFSIEWSRIQPSRTTFDTAVLDEYAQRIAQLIKEGKTPFVGFHHYSDAKWFMYRDETDPQDFTRGGFEKEENIALFVNYCAKTFNHINAAIKPILDALPEQQREKLRPRWLTFNSPGSYAISGYYRAQRPPKKQNMQLAVNVYEHMLKANNLVYKEIKKQDAQALVGITHNIFHLDPNPSSDYASWMMGSLAAYLGNWMSNSSGLHFFTDGQMKLWVPGKASKNMAPWRQAQSLMNRWLFDKSQKTLDFICINYYSHAHMYDFKNPRPAENELKTSLPQYTIYAEGLYRAIKETYDRVAKPLGIPMYITENGFSENDIVENGKPVNGDERRKLFLNRHLYTIAKAIKDGYPIKGYMYWSLYDNCEWDQGYNKSFGLADRDRVLKPSGEHYARLIKPIIQPSPTQ